MEQTQAELVGGGGAFSGTGRDAVGRERWGKGTAPLVEDLNHFNSVTTALCKCTQSFITVTAIIGMGFRGTLGL